MPVMNQNERADADPRSPAPEGHDELRGHEEETRRRVYAAFLTSDGTPREPAEWGVDLGAARAYAREHGVYERVFERGLSLANPTDHVECVTLPHAYRDLNGVEHTIVCLPPHTGELLIDAEPGPSRA
jgi:hypothetical protein